jgi:hypothetical protein
MRWVEHVARMDEMRNGYKILVEKTERDSSEWEDNIKIGLIETGWENVDWSHLAQDRDQWRGVVSTAMNLRILQKAENFLTS